MENYIVGNNNDFLSQSYSQSIERITRTTDHILDFQLPHELVKIRKKLWQNVFDKYMEEMSDEIELNVDTLEPEEDEDEDEENHEENDEEFSKEECKDEQRAPMRKPAFLIQYWIDTGNPPYKILLHKDKFETDLSVTEKETAPAQKSQISTATTDIISYVGNSCNKRRSNSSCSSVNTAAYILSNTNITKKADTIAIIEGAKCADKSSRTCVKATDILSDDKIVHIETMGVDDVHNNVDSIDVSRNTLAEYTASEIHDQHNTHAIILSNGMQCTLSQNLCCEKTDKNDASITSETNLDIRNMDNIVSIFQQFDKTSKRLNQENKMDEDKTSDKNVSHSEQVLTNDINEKVIESDADLTLLHRKKLYTGRDSPVDLMQIKTHSTNKKCGTNKILHPALDSECIIKTKSLIPKNKTKRTLVRKTNSDFKVDEAADGKKMNWSTFNKNTADVDNIDDKVTINNDTQNSNVEASNSLSDCHNDLDVRQNDVLLPDDNGTNISVKNKTHMQYLTSLNPIVLLERIVPSFKRTFDSVANNDTTQKHEYLNTSKKLYSCNVENIDLEIESDESTIIICKCNKDIMQRNPSSKQRFLYSTSENDSTSVATKNDEKNTLINHKDLKSADIKEALVVLERLPLSEYHLPYENRTQTIEIPQNLNVTDSTSQEEILNSSKKSSSNLSEVSHKKNNIILREVKIVLERLPVNLHLKRSSNVSDASNSINAKTNSIVGKKDILHNISRHNNERENRKLQSRTKIYKTRKRRNSIQTSKSNNINNSLNISDNISKYTNQTLNETELNAISQYEDHIAQVKYDTHTSSGKDEITQPMKRSRKRLRILTDNETSETEVKENDKTKLLNKNKDGFSKNANLTIHSPSKIALKRSNRSTNKKNRLSKIKTNYFPDDSASSDSSQINKSETWSISSNRKNDKDKKRNLLFLNFSKNVNSDSKKSSSITSRSKVDCKNNVHVFQTKIFHSDSSDSERSNNFNIFNRKARRQVNNSIRQKSHYDNDIKKKTFFDCSVKKKNNQKDLNSLNSSAATRDTTLVTSKKVKISEQFDNEEFNDDINSEIIDATRNTMNNVANVLTHKETHSYISSEKHNKATRNKQISEKSNGSVTIQQNTSANSITRLLTFQTKSYHDSDSDDSS